MGGQIKRPRTLVHRGHRYRESRVLTNRNISWRCTKRRCVVTVHTDPEVKGFVGTYSCVDGHTHEPAGDSGDDTLRVLEYKDAVRRPREVATTVQDENDSTPRPRPSNVETTEPVPEMHWDTIASTTAAVAAENRPGDDSPPLLYLWDTESRIMMYASAVYLQYLSEADELMADGCSWKTVCPDGFERLYAVHVRRDGVCVQAAFCLLPDRTLETYESAWRLLRSCCPGGRLEPRVVLVDVDPVAHRAAERAFPRARVRLSRHNVLRAWHDRLVRLDLGRDYYEAAAAAAAAASADTVRPGQPVRTLGEWLTRFFGFPMLSPDRVPDAFRQLLDAVPVVAPGRHVIAAATFACDVRAHFIKEPCPFPPRLWASSPSDDRDDGDWTPGPSWLWRREHELFRAEKQPSVKMLGNALCVHLAQSWAALKAAGRFGRWKKKMASHSMVLRSKRRLWRALVENRLSTIDYLHVAGRPYMVT